MTNLEKLNLRRLLLYIEKSIDEIIDDENIPLDEFKIDTHVKHLTCLKNKSVIENFKIIYDSTDKSLHFEILPIPIAEYIEIKCKILN